jgi:hypothetical protein
VDSPATESNVAPEAPQPSFKERLAAHLKADHGDAFEYEPTTDEPQGQLPESPVEEALQASAPETETTETPASEPEQPADDGMEAVEVEGKEYKVPRELKDHLMRDRDYRNKTMELAEMRKGVEQVAQVVNMGHQAMSQAAPILAQLGVIDSHLSDAQRVDWPALYANDPARFAAEQQRYNNLMGQRQHLMGQLNTIPAAVAQAQAAQFNQEVERNRPLVKQHMPDFNEDRAKAVIGFLQSGPMPMQGNDLQISDARLLYHLNRSYELSRIEAERGKTMKQVSTAPPVNKSTQRTPTTGAQIEVKKAESRLAKEGSTEAAMALLQARRRAQQG